MAEGKASRAERLTDARGTLETTVLHLDDLGGRIEEALEQLKGASPTASALAPVKVGGKSEARAKSGGGSKSKARVSEPVDAPVLDIHELVASVSPVLKDVCELIDEARDEIRTLAEEIEGGREAIEEHFSTTDRYSRLAECEEQLNGLVTALDEADFHVPQLSELPDEDTRALTDDQLLSVLESLHEQCEALENALKDVAEETEEITFPTARD